MNKGNKNKSSISSGSKSSKVNLTLEERRLTRTSLRFDYAGRSRKFTNPEQFQSSVVSETRASYQLPKVSRSPEMKEIKQNVLPRTPRPKKQVTFKDDGDNKLGTTIPDNNKNYIETSKATAGPIMKREDLAKRLLYLVQGFASIETPHSRAPPVNQYAKLSDLSDPTKPLFVVDMSGFNNENIEFYQKGRRLIIEGIRPIHHPYISSRRTQEIVHLPHGMNCENLRVARDDDGTLIFEEAWKF